MTQVVNSTFNLYAHFIEEAGVDMTTAEFPVHNCRENPRILVSCNCSAILSHKILAILVSCILRQGRLRTVAAEN